MGRHSTPGPGDDSDDEPYVDDTYVDETFVQEPFEQPRGDTYRDEGVSDETAVMARYRDPEPTHGDPKYPDQQHPDAGYRADPRDVYSDDHTDTYTDGTYTDDYVDEYADDEFSDAGYDDRSGLDESSADPLPPATGGFGSGHRNDGELTGSHRIISGAPGGGRRGVSFGVIAALVTVVVLVAGFILWRFFGDAISDRSNVAGDRCLKGDAKVAVLADPAIAEYVGQFAEKFNKTAGPIGDHCASVSVKSADSDAVVNGLVGQWPADLGDKPALWIPGSSVSAARLQAAAGAQSVSATKSLVKSPVVLAINPALKPALEQQTWGTLPGLQSDPTALDNLNLPGWGSLRLALPTIGDSDATYLAAEAVAAAAAPAGAPPTSGAGAVSTLVSGAPKLAANTTDDAMAVLLAGGAPEATVHAVATTEQQLIHRTAALPDAKNVLASWLPPGPVAVADFPSVLLAGDWLADEQVSAASEFERFMRKPDQLAELSKAGFRTDDNAPPGSDVGAGAPLAQALSVGEDNVRVTLANALTAPVNGSAASIMLDRSLNLAPVVAGLDTRIGTLSPTSSVGLTVFDGGAGTTVVNLGQLSDQVEGRPRSEVLISTLNGLTSAGGGGVSFTTLRNVYADALAGFRQGQNNSVLVITSGPHTDQSLDSDGLQAMIRSSADPARPVAVNVINVGNDPDRATWEAVAQISGGTFQNVPASDSPEMAAAINSMLA